MGEAAEGEPTAVEPAVDPALLRTLEAAGLPARGPYLSTHGWVSRAWVGEDDVVRLSDGRFRDAYRHEAAVVGLLEGSEVPHAPHIAHGDGPDGPWSVSERLPGRTLHAAWPKADRSARRALIESLGSALRALHQVPVPENLRPPWLADALAGEPWPAYHPPVVSAAPAQVEAARRRPDHDARLLADVAAWIQDRMGLFADDRPVLVHGDLHGSNVMIDQGRVTGLIDFAEASAQAADAELDTLLRWCARSEEFPPTPGGHGLERSTLAEVPRWLHAAYPELFQREHLRERLAVYDLTMELAIYAHHPEPGPRGTAQGRLTRMLRGRSHLDGVMSQLDGLVE